MADRGGERPKRVLMLSLNYAPEQVGIGPYSAGLAQMLAESGWSVDVVAGQPYYPEWEAQGSGWKDTEEAGVQVQRCPHYVPRKPTGPRRLLHHASFALSALFPAVFTAIRERPEIVFVVAPSLMAFPISWLAAKLVGAKLWLHVQDFEVEAALATGLLEHDGAAAKLASDLEVSFLRACDLVTTISPQMVQRLEAKGVAENRRLEMRNWANHAVQIAQSSGDDLRSEWGVEGCVVALYSGNMAGKQGLETVLDAARQLAERKDIVFVLAGEGTSRARLESAAADLGNVRFLPLQPEAKFAQMLRAADIHLLPQVANAADLVLPSKLTNMLASARPVVATAGKGTGLAAEVEGCGIVTAPHDGAALASAIAKLADDADLRERLGTAAGKRAEERWTASATLKAFERGARKLGVAAGLDASRGAHG